MELLRVKIFDFSFSLFSVQMDEVVLGKIHVLPNVKSNSPVLVKAVHTHHNFSGFPSTNDLALLELQEPIKPGTAWAQYTQL